MQTCLAVRQDGEHCDVCVFNDKLQVDSQKLHVPSTRERALRRSG